MADKKKCKTPAKGRRVVRATTKSSSTKRRQLLNSYLKSKPASKTSKSKVKAASGKASAKPSAKKTKSKKKVMNTTNKLATTNSSKVDASGVRHIKRPRVKQLGDIQNILGDRPTSSQLAARVKQLGSIEAILQGSVHAQEAQVIRDTSDYLDHERLFAKRMTNTTGEKIDTSAFQSSADADKTFNLTRNLPVFAVSVFSVGACIFGINQLIKNANLDFAAENPDPQAAVAPPRILTFQGRLSDYDQKSITAPKQMRFTLYNTSGGTTPPPIGGEVLWDSGFCTVKPSSSGIFTVNLGAGKGDGHDDYNCGQTLGTIFAENSNIWLQITVDDEVLFPRQLIKSVPFALNSETLQGYSASASATANTIPVVDSNGNLKFGTNNTSIINVGGLNLVSQNGDIYLLPGNGELYVGSATQSANLNLNGNLRLNGKNSTITYSDDGLTFRSSAAQTIWNSLVVDKNGNLGLGTNKTKQKLTINNGSIAFEYASGPDISKMTLSEDIVNQNALRRIDSPESTLKVSTQDQPDAKIQPGTYKYAYTFVTSDGSQTSLSPATELKLSTSGKVVVINDLATSSHPAVTARNLYRTRDGGDTYYFVKTIRDNTSTSTYDITPDEDLSTTPSNLSSTGKYRYRVTYVTSKGESAPSSASDSISVTGDGRVIKITNIPLASSPDVTARRLYRSLSNSDDYYLVSELTDNTTTVYDTYNDFDLVTHTRMPSAGSIYTNGRLSLQFADNGTIVASDNITAQGRINTSYGDNQGLQVPTSVGKPYAKAGQQMGDIVYDSVGQVLYIYNGTDFVPTGITGENAVSLANSSNCTGNVCRLVLDAEYAGAVISGDGSHNNGTFTAGTQTVGENYRFNYYSWSSADLAVLNDFDATINLTLPSNFTSWSSNGITLDYATTSTDPSLNNVQLEVYRGGTEIGAVASNLVSETAASWMSAALGTTPATITGEQLSNLGFKAGDRLTIRIKTASKQSQEVKIGQININYVTDSGVTSNGTQSLWKQVAGVIFPTTNSDILLGGEATSSASIGFLNLAGNGTPTLMVRGNIFMDSLTKKNNLDLASQTSFNIRTLNADNTATTRFTILPNGNIGIGTANPTEALEVAGNVKVDGALQLSPIDETTAGVCAVDTEGKIYYDSNDKAFYACQADLNTGLYSWQPLN